MVLIISSSPLKRKEMDRKVVNDKRLAEMKVSASLEAAASLAGPGAFQEFALRQV
jgi:hypothetical protein